MKYFSLMCMAAALSAPAWAAPLMAEPETLRAEYCRSKTEPCSKVSVTRAKFKQTAYTHFADDVLKSRLYLTDLIRLTDLSRPALSRWIVAAAKPEKDMPYYVREYQADVSLLGYTPEYWVLEDYYYEYTGGAYGIDSQVFYVLPREGQQTALTLPRIVLPGKMAELGRLQLAAWVQYLMNEGMSAQEIRGLLSDFKFVPTDNWRFSRNGLRFLFQSYEIAPDSMGRPQLTLTLEQLQGIVRPEILREAERYHVVASESE